MTQTTASSHSRRDPLPHPTAEEAEAAPGDRAAKAARNIVSRNIAGIPKRGYILGDCDHAPIVRGVAELTAVVYGLLDHLDPEPDAPSALTAVVYGLLDHLDPEPDAPSALERETLDRIAILRAMLEDHRCPPAEQ